MTEPLIIAPGPDSGSWKLLPPIDPWSDGYVAVMRVELHDQGLDAFTDVDLSRPLDGTDFDLVAFLQGLADDWRGWHGERTYRSLDGKMRITARHDGSGHVALRATLTGSASLPDAWSAAVTVTLEAGEQLNQLVADTRVHLTTNPTTDPA